MAVNSTSFTNTPQAGDDNYTWTEDQLLASGLVNADVISLNVMGNDLGGKAKTLFSIDDGNGNALAADFQLLAPDVTNGVSAWETTAGGNWVRINNGQIEFKLGGAASSAPAPDIDSLSVGQHIDDEFVYAIRLANGTLSQARVTLHITGTNDAATVSSESKSVSEGDTAAALNTSGALTIADVDSGEAHVVAQTNVHGAYGDFSIDANGAWTYVGNGAHDELHAGEVVSDSFIVKSQDGTASGVVKVTITGTNDAPMITSGSTGTVAENAPTSTVVYDASASDPDAGDTVGFSLGGTDAAAFSIDATTGEVRLNASADFEAKTSYAIDVIGTDAGGLTNTKAVTINVTNVNEAPSVTSASTGTVAENAPTSTVVYDASASDPDAGDTVGFSLGGADAAAFNIDATTGEVRLNTSANYEAKSSYVIDVIGTDGGGLSSTKAVTVTVTNVNEAPTITSGASGSVAENAPASTVVYTATSSDVDAGANGQVSYTLTGADASLLSINAAGQVTLNTVANFEAKSSYAFNVVATDGGTPSLADTKAVTIGVVDVNEAPTAVVPSNVLNSIDENTSTASHIKVADLAVTDDALGTNTLSLSGADAASFEIAGNALYLKAGVALDYETKTSYAVNVNVNDPSVGGNPDASQSFTLNVNNLTENVAPVALGESIVISDNVTVINKAWVLGNDSDSDGGTLVFASLPTGLSVEAITGDLLVNVAALSGGTTYTPAGTRPYTVYDLSYTVSDGQGGVSTQATLKLAVVDTTSQGDTVDLGIVASSLGGSYTYSKIDAQNGIDGLTGTAAQDTFIGGAGDDTIKGSAGADTLTGDGGVDTFVFNSALGGGNVDAITDFRADENASNQDWIELSATIFTNAGATGGFLNAADFLSVNGIANVTAGNSANVIYDSATGSLYYDANAGAAGDAVMFATLQFSGSTAGSFGAGDIKVGP